MVKRWTNQLNVSAQMEVMSLLPTTTGSPVLNKGSLQYQVKHMFCNHILQSVLHKMFYLQFLPVEECALADNKTKHSC